MHISDLNTKTLTNPAWVAFDDGTDTYKAEFNEVVSDAAEDAVADADLTDNEVAFTSGDALSPTAWTDVDVLTTGSTLATLFNKISTMIKNIRWIKSKIADTGWVDITSYLNTSIFTVRGTGFEPQIRKIGDVLYFRGEIYLSASGQSSDLTAFSSLPSEYRPTAQISGSGITLGGVTFTIWLNVSGNLRIHPSSYAVQTATAGFALANLSGCGLKN